MVIVNRGPLMQPEPENEYARVYDKLTLISEKFRAMTKYLDRNQWVAFNNLRDEGKGMSEITDITKIPVWVLEQAEHPRRCRIKWDDKDEKVLECIDGKIDP